MGDTCWEVSDMGGETLDTGALMCLFAQALVRFRLGWDYREKKPRETLVRAALSRISITWMWSLLTTRSLTN